MKLFQAQKDENWALPVLFCVTLDLRLFANSVSVFTAYPLSVLLMIPVYVSSVLGMLL